MYYIILIFLIYFVIKEIFIVEYYKSIIILDDIKDDLYVHTEYDKLTKEFELDKYVPENEDENEDDDEIPEYKNDEAFLEFINQYTYYDENNELIDHNTYEVEEQYQVYKFIKPDDIVLELGGRYGTVSVLINKILKNKKLHIVVEPDISVIVALYKNRNNNKCEFEIINKYISNISKKIYYDGYSTRILNNENEIENIHSVTEDERIENDKKRFLLDDSDNIFSITYNEFKKLYPYDFNTLVLDCEGCLCEFITTMGDDFKKIKKIIFEADQPSMCNYENIIIFLEENNFKKIDESFNIVYRYVYIRN
jgi:hypothetical protein